MKLWIMMTMRDSGSSMIKNFQLFLYCSHRWLFFTNPELISIVHHQTAFLSLWESFELVGLWQFSQSSNSMDSYREKRPSGGEQYRNQLWILEKNMLKFWRKNNSNSMQPESTLFPKRNTSLICPFSPELLPSQRNMSIVFCRTKVLKRRILWV